MTEGRIAVRLVTRASRNRLLGVRDGVLHARVTAPPVDGKANKALCRLIAKQLGVAPSQIDIVRGQRSQSKVLGVKGVDEATLERLLADARQ